MSLRWMIGNLEKYQYCSRSQDERLHFLNYMGLTTKMIR